MFIRLVMNIVFFFFFQGEEERKYVEVKNRAENQTIFLLWIHMSCHVQIQ